MDAVTAAQLIEGHGLVGNANQGGRRQVTIIELEAWQRMMQELGASLPPSTRRANIMLSGVRLNRRRGALLRLGDCLLEILGETRPCNLMDEALPGLRTVMQPQWRGGVFARVLRGGTLRVGDPAQLRSAEIDLFETTG